VPRRPDGGEPKKKIAIIPVVNTAYQADTPSHQLKYLRLSCILLECSLLVYLNTVRHPYNPRRSWNKAEPPFHKTLQFEQKQPRHPTVYHVFL
jgi:hypothetical protein